MEEKLDKDHLNGVTISVELEGITKPMEMDFTFLGDGLHLIDQFHVATPDKTYPLMEKLFAAMSGSDFADILAAIRTVEMTILRSVQHTVEDMHNATHDGRLELSPQEQREVCIAHGLFPQMILSTFERLAARLEKEPENAVNKATEPRHEPEVAEIIDLRNVTRH